MMIVNTKLSPGNVIKNDRQTWRYCLSSKEKLTAVCRFFSKSVRLGM